MAKLFLLIIYLTSLITPFWEEEKKKTYRFSETRSASIIRSDIQPTNPTLLRHLDTNRHYHHPSDSAE